jgi:hypothetical protein
MDWLMGFQWIPRGEISHGWIVFVGFYGWISPFTVKTCFKLLLLPANI